MTVQLRSKHVAFTLNTTVVLDVCYYNCFKHPQHIVMSSIKLTNLSAEQLNIQSQGEERKYKNGQRNWTEGSIEGRSNTVVQLSYFICVLFDFSISCFSLCLCCQFPLSSVVLSALLFNQNPLQYIQTHSFGMAISL
jgi:hypothetical protein